MAFPTSTKTKASIFELVHETLLPQLKTNMTAYATQLAGSVNGDLIINGVLATANQAKPDLVEAQAFTGMNAYAQAELDDVGFLWDSEMLAIVQANQAIIDWVITNAPQASGYLQFRTLEVDGTITERQFAPAGTAGLVTAINALTVLIS